MKVTQPQLGRILRAYRQIRGEGIQTIAARANINKSVLSKLENGKDVQLSTLNKVLGALNLTLTLSPGRFNGSGYPEQIAQRRP